MGKSWAWSGFAASSLGGIVALAIVAACFSAATSLSSSRASTPVKQVESQFEIEFSGSVNNQSIVIFRCKSTGERFVHSRGLNSSSAIAVLPTAKPLTVDAEKAGSE